MTELERIAYARIYIEKLANGVNPLDDTPVGTDDIVNNVHVSRCLFFASDILRKVYENGGVTNKYQKYKKTGKLPFSVTKEQLSTFKFSNVPVPLTDIINQINAMPVCEDMYKLKRKTVQDWLIEKGYISEFCDEKGRNTTRPTAQGNGVGIATEVRQGQYESYIVTLYNRQAQQLIIDNIGDIALHNNDAKEKRANDGQRWDDAQDKMLVEMFKDGILIGEIAKTMKRSEGSISARLVKLGLIERRSDV
jgi:hypothetical protein